MKRWMILLLCAALCLTSGCVSKNPIAYTPIEPIEVEETTPIEPETPSDPEPSEATEPQPAVNEAGRTAEDADLHFDAVTIDGKAIDDSMIRPYDLVIVNCWAEWCPPCVGEMPELERIHQEYPNVLLLGVLSFSYDMDGAKETVSDTGVTYPMFEPAGSLVKLVNRFDAIPATMFFDNAGNEIADPIVGAMNYQQWKAVIEDLLP